MNKDLNVLNQLMREHEAIAGSSRSTLLSIRAFMAAIQELTCPEEQVKEQYSRLADAIKSTQPKIIPLIHLLEEFESEMAPYFGGDHSSIQLKALEILKAKYEKLHTKSGKIIERGLTCVNHGDTLVVHTVNLNVISIITLAHEVMGKELNVIVLQQDMDQTKRVVQPLREAGVPHQALPEYALTHFIGQANKMFCAALSVTADQKVVAPVGTANIASLCHFHNIPVYLFANTLKFAHGLSQDQHIHRETVTVAKDADAYELTTYSHDVMDLSMVDHLITEDGVYAKDQIESYLQKMHT